MQMHGVVHACSYYQWFSNTVNLGDDIGCVYVLSEDAFLAASECDSEVFNHCPPTDVCITSPFAAASSARQSSSPSCPALACLRPSLRRLLGHLVHNVLHKQYDHFKYFALPHRLDSSTPFWLSTQ